jgi:protease I
MSQKQLAGVRVAVLAMDGFEQVELTGPLKMLKREDADVELLSLHKGKIRGVNHMAPGRRVGVDRLVKDARAEDYDALLIPGGHVSPDFLRASTDALRFVADMEDAHKPIGVICHAPWVLASAGLVKGRRLTSWPNIKDDLKNAGASWSDQAVVRDRNWVSSRGPQDLKSFEKELVSLFAEQADRSSEHAREKAGPLRRLKRAAWRMAITGLLLYGWKRIARREKD